MAQYAYTFTSGDTVTPTKLNNARTVSNIANADISATAAIDGTKVAPNFGSQNVTTTGVVRLNGAAAGSFGAVSTSAGSPQLRLINNGSNTNVASVVMSKSRADNLVDDADPLGIIAFQGHDGTNYQSTAAISAFGDGTATSTSLPTAINFSTAATGSVSTAERMRITSAGNVGIANASPSEKLHVTGNIKASGFIDTNTSFRGQASDSAAAPSYTWTGDTDTGVFRPAADTLAFAEGGSEVMRINSSGNVGIGTAAPGTKLDVSGTVTATAFSGPLTGNASTATTLATGRTISLTGDVTATTGSFNGSANATAAATIANNAVSDAKLRDSDALSVIGRSANSSGDPGDITASTDGHVLRRSGTNLGFGTVATAGIADSAVTDAKVSASAAIAGSKISPDFGSQNVVTTGTATAAKLIPTGTSAAGNGVYLPAANTLAVSTNGSERFRVDSTGVVLVGSTSDITSAQTGLKLDPAGQFVASRASGAGSLADFYRPDDGTMQYFLRNNSIVGSISVTTSATAYNVSSDHRLKTNVNDLASGLATVEAIRPRAYDWISSGEQGVGFVAHELQEVVPLAVTGTKDAVDDKGEIVPQQVDASKLVPYLVAAIQELSAKVAALEAK